MSVSPFRGVLGKMPWQGKSHSNSLQEVVGETKVKIFPWQSLVGPNGVLGKKVLTLCILKQVLLNNRTTVGCERLASQGIQTDHFINIVVLHPILESFLREGTLLLPSIQKSFLAVFQMEKMSSNLHL